MSKNRSIEIWFGIFIIMATIPFDLFAMGIVSRIIACLIFGIIVIPILVYLLAPLYKDRHKLHSSFQSSEKGRPEFSKIEAFQSEMETIEWPRKKTVRDKLKS